MTSLDPTSVVYPGSAGSYTSEAADRLYPAVEAESAGSFADVYAAVADGGAEVGVLPIENTLAGIVADTCDLIADGALPIVAETIIHIPHCLAGVAGATTAGITTIHSHPVALAQCRTFLDGRYDQRAEGTTADAARIVAELGDPACAAIASPAAAKRYGLEILEHDISDHPDNMTRFVALGREPLPFADGTPWKTALRIVTGHQPGALHDAIEPLRYHGVNMLSLHSRPIPGEPWRYQFLVDIEGHRDDPRIARALEDVRSRSAVLVVLGSFPAAAHPDAP
ncbi:MAG: prephenate dehydratase [Gaiellales bacterium]